MCPRRIGSLMAARVFPDFLKLILGLAGLYVAGFFMATLVLPLDTLGDPAFDIPQLRRRWFEGFGVNWIHIGLVLGLIWRMARHPGRAVAVALAASATALTLMQVEEEQLIRHGTLILPHDASMFRLNVNRFGTAALSVIALLAFWRAHARH